MLTLAFASEPAADPALEAKVVEIFEESCTMCHSAGGDETDPGGLPLEGSPTALVGRKSVVVDKLLVKPGDPAGSYLLTKMTGGAGMEGDLMPMGDRLPDDQLEAVKNWIASLPAEETSAGGTGDGPPSTDGGTTTPPAGADTPLPKAPGKKPFHGTHQVVLPTTTTLGKRTLQYRIDHRFGRIGTERGAFGLDAGVVMSMGLAYGILDGWDVRLRRTNARKAWELGTKYVPIRQEDGAPLSFGGYISMDWFRDFDVQNQISGNFLAMLSRLWFERWSTMLTLSYHLPTNKNTRVLIDFEDNNGPVPVEDTRGTLTMGLASTVWLGKRKRWGIDLEYLLPIPAGGDSPDVFYFRGGDADPGGTKIGAWSLGGSYFSGKHFFQVFFSNNRDIHLNQGATGGQTKNPFSTPGVDSSNPFHKFNFYLGFNLGRRFTLGKRVDKARKRKAEAKKASAAAPTQKEGA